MRSFIFIAFIALAFSNILRDEYEYLKNFATFQVADIETNRFKDYSDEELKSYFSLKLNDPKDIQQEEITLLATIPETYDFRTEYP